MAGCGLKMVTFQGAGRGSQVRTAEARSDGGGGGPASGMGGGGGGASEEEISELKGQIKRLKAAVAAAKEPNGKAGQYSKDPEKRAAELMTRNAVLETELENYQKST